MIRYSTTFALSLFAAAALPAAPVLAGALPTVAVAVVAPSVDPSVAPSTAFNSTLLLGELTRAVVAHFNLEGELQLELLRPFNGPKQTAATWQVSVSEFPILAQPTMLLHFRVIGDGAVIQDDALLVRAALWRDSWFARQPISSGSIFDPSFLESRKIDCLREHDGLPANSGNNSYIFSRDIPSDRMITWHDLARRPLVHKGELVQVIATEGRLSVTMKAMALENGAKGDLITVRNPESNRNITGQVIDDGRVLVHF